MSSRGWKCLFCASACSTEERMSHGDSGGRVPVGNPVESHPVPSHGLPVTAEASTSGLSQGQHMSIGYEQRILDFLSDMDGVHPNLRDHPITKAHVPTQMEVPRRSMELLRSSAIARRGADMTIGTSSSYGEPSDVSPHSTESQKSDVRSQMWAWNDSFRSASTAQRSWAQALTETVKDCRYMNSNSKAPQRPAAARLPGPSCTAR
jgi:hypothetical protein